jgi:hypothetical protein
MNFAGAASLTAGLSAAMVDQTFAAGDNQAISQRKLERAYDYIVAVQARPARSSPGENALAMASMITGGTLERHPRLRIAFSHGGGGFARARRFAGGPLSIRRFQATQTSRFP